MKRILLPLLVATFVAFTLAFWVGDHQVPDPVCGDRNPAGSAIAAHADAALPEAAARRHVPSGFAAQVGDRFVFSLHGTCGGELAGAESGERTVTLDGSMAVHVVGARGSRLLLRSEVLAFGTAPQLIGGKGLVEFECDGRVRGFAFDDDIPPAARSLLRTWFVRTHQFVWRPLAEAAPWTASLTDECGALEARFRWGGDVLLREVLRRTPPNSGGSDITAGVEVARSADSATFANGWIARSIVEEDARICVGGIDGKFQLRLEANLLSRSYVPVEAEPAWPESLDAPDVSEPFEVEQSPPLDDLLAALRALEAESGTEGQEFQRLWMQLVRALRARPEDVDALLATLLACAAPPPLSERLADALVGALGAAATESAAAARALGDLMGGAGDPGLRRSAITAAHQVRESRSSDLRTTVASSLQDVLDFESDPELQMLAGLAYGTVAGDVVPGTDAILARIRASSEAGGNPQFYLSVLANTGSVERIVSEALPACAAADDLVRAAAAEALAHCPRVREATVQLVELTRDPADVVRVAAIDALVGHDAELAVPVLARIAETDPSPAIRRRAVLALVAQGGAVARQVLRRIAVQDTDAGVRAAAAW